MRVLSSLYINVFNVCYDLKYSSERKVETNNGVDRLISVTRIGGHSSPTIRDAY